MNLIREWALWLASEPRDYERFIGQRLEMFRVKEQTKADMRRLTKNAIEDVRRASNSLR